MPNPNTSADFHLLLFASLECPSNNIGNHDSFSLFWATNRKTCFQRLIEVDLGGYVTLFGF